MKKTILLLLIVVAIPDFCNCFNDQNKISENKRSGRVDSLKDIGVESKIETIPRSRYSQTIAKKLGCSTNEFIPFIEEELNRREKCGELRKITNALQPKRGALLDVALEAASKKILQKVLNDSIMHAYEKAKYENNVLSGILGSGVLGTVFVAIAWYWPTYLGYVG